MEPVGGSRDRPSGRVTPFVHIQGQRPVLETIGLYLFFFDGNQVGTGHVYLSTTVDMIYSGLALRKGNFKPVA